ncbi:reverse transcriptase/maturase family protein, partial [Patescibacteria group bacterium]|nr:reverse transcriptase/maturase family protein [Patescibacteria group bacterium]
QLSHSFDDIISVENLLGAWKEFVKGKTGRADVQEFSLRLIDNILLLHNDLCHHTYEHGSYQAFSVHDPKPRDIHKASVRDRLLHHAIHRVLYPFFDKTFIADSFSCRIGKGTHKALNRFRQFAYRASANHTKTCWVLKCDIRKFFASIDQGILVDILRTHIPDSSALWLLERIMKSFSSTAHGKGLPLGNLTSQLLANIYMNEFDRFAKHSLKAKHYIRYADDFVILSDNYEWLFRLIPRIRHFLREKLKLELHPDKVSIKTVASGVDFLGWVHFPDHRVLRTATKRRMLKKLARAKSDAALQSYLGLLSHGNGEKIRRNILNCGASLVERSNGFSQYSHENRYY